MCKNPFKVVKKAVKTVGKTVTAPFNPPKVKMPAINIPEPPPPPPPAPPAPPPPTPPAPPALSAALKSDLSPFASEEGASNEARRRGRRSLRIDLASGLATSGGTGLNVPKG